MMKFQDIEFIYANYFYLLFQWFIYFIDKDYDKTIKKNFLFLIIVIKFLIIFRIFIELFYNLKVFIFCYKFIILILFTLDLF